MKDSTPDQPAKRTRSGRDETTVGVLAGGPATIRVRRDGDELLTVEVAGDWRMRRGLPGAEVVEKELQQQAPPRTMGFDLTGLGGWNSGLVSFVLKCHESCKRHQMRFADETLSPGLRQLVHLALAVPESKDARREPAASGMLHRLGAAAMESGSQGLGMVTLLGESALAFLTFLRGDVRFRWPDLWLLLQQCGPEALGVVALINFLVGVILAFVGSVQLKQFGASIYVADLVAIGTVREMGCIMTGVILCGRTGAAFAAQLGAMKVNEEIDAFRTFAISPIEFLVLPRILALFLMMPLLCVFADAIAIFGGFLVSVSMLDVTPTEYLRRTVESITLTNFLLGIVKGGFFGILVAVSGCLRGMQCGTNAAAVGRATTSAVVTGITSIVAADGVFAVLCNALGI